MLQFEGTYRLGVVSCLLVPYRPAFRAVRQALRVVRVGMRQAWPLVLLGVGAWQLVLRGERTWQPVWRLGGYRLALDELLDRRPRREACRAAAGRETSVPTQAPHRLPCSFTPQHKLPCPYTQQHKRPCLAHTHTHPHDPECLAHSPECRPVWHKQA